MGKIRVQSHGSKIRIKLNKEAQSQNGSEPSSSTAKTTQSPLADADTLQLASRVIEFMEVRAESIFRPNAEDIEVIYALSGASRNVPDMWHKLSSRTVVEEASAEHIVSSVGAMLEHISMEREGKPSLIVHVHTHPQGIPSPSQADKRFFKNVAQTMLQSYPECEVLFGIHAVSDESIRERQEPHLIAKNTIKWSSIYCEHETAFFDAEAKPYKVAVLDQY